MTPDELTGAACKLAHALGIRVYIRDGRIYQHGLGREFLPPTGSSAAVADVSSDEDAFSTKRTRGNEPVVSGGAVPAVPLIKAFARACH
jgi:hypothetical protein